MSCSTFQGRSLTIGGITYLTIIQKTGPIVEIRHRPRSGFATEAPGWNEAKATDHRGTGRVHREEHTEKKQQSYQGESVRRLAEAY